MEHHNFILRVIESCKNEEHRLSAYQWLSVLFNQNKITKIELLSYINNLNGYKNV